MKERDFLHLIGKIDDKYIAEMSDTYVGETPVLSSCTERRMTKTMNSTHRSKPLGRAYRRIIMIAAVIAVFFALGIVAYATNIFGLRALFIQDNEQRTYTYENQADGTVIKTENPDGGFMSITQPQDVPEGLDPNIAEKVDKSKAAWEEWSIYTHEHALIIPEVFTCEGAHASDVVENENGTYTITFYSLPDDLSMLEDMEPFALPILETRIATAEEYDEFQRYVELMAKASIDGYDFNYHAYTQEAANTLEQIASKYGLNLRRERHSLFSSDTAGITGEGYLTNAQLAAKTAEFGNSGNIFNQTPVGFDKVYWFDEGTFCVSFYVDLPSTGERVTCYGYNSIYSTLSSGEEVFNMESDLKAFNARIYTALDGTDVTILFNGVDSAYIYVYLDNSFFAEHITSVEGLTDADLDFIADQINYSLISK